MDPDVDQQAPADGTTLQDDLGTAFDDQPADDLAGDPEPELEPLAAVERWDKGLKDTFSEWGSLENGRTYQQALLDYHTEQQGYHTKLEQDIAPLRNESESWNGVFQPHQEFLMHNGLTPQDAARRGLGIMANMSQDPTAFALDILQRTNYDFASHGQEQTYVPPEVKALQERLDVFERGQQNTMMQSQNEAADQINQQIQSFASATSESGDLLHPHFETVEQQMSMMVFGYKGTGQPIPPLSELYDKACQQNSDIQAQVKAEETAKETARKAADAKKAKQAAQRAEGSHSGTESSSSSLKDDIGAEFDKQAAA